MVHGVARELCSFNIPPSVRAKLTRAGFRTSKDIDGLSVVELTKGDDDKSSQCPMLWSGQEGVLGPPRGMYLATPRDDRLTSSLAVLLQMRTSPTRRR